MALILLVLLVLLLTFDIVSISGFNDQVCSPGWKNRASFRCTNSNMTKAITKWLLDVRAATSPTTVVIVLQPFGSEMRTKNLTRFAIKAGFDAYQRAANDEHAMLVDLYPRSKLGLMGADTSANCTGKFCSGQAPGPTANSCDGTHPLAHRHAHLGAMVAAEVSSRLKTDDSADVGAGTALVNPVPLFDTQGRYMNIHDGDVVQWEQNGPVSPQTAICLILHRADQILAKSCATSDHQVQIVIFFVAVDDCQLPPPHPK